MQHICRCRYFSRRLNNRNSTSSLLIDPCPQQKKNAGACSTNSCRGAKGVNPAEDQGAAVARWYCLFLPPQFAAASRVSISSRNAEKSIGFVSSPLAPFSSALRLVSASP